MFAPGAGRFLGPVAAVLVLFAALVAGGWVERVPGLVVVALLLALFAFLAVFFRDPERPVGPGVVSAADGRVRSVEQVDGRLVVSVFMNVTNVHVNRTPVDARVDATRVAGAGHRAAYRPDAGENVRRHYALATEYGPVEVVQITGVLARRLVPFVGPGRILRKGERFGMIILGSRVDVHLPADRFRPVVNVGDRVRAGATSIAVERS